MTFFQDGIGRPDDLDRLWTPHRMAYVRGENRPQESHEQVCPFCRIPSLSDAESLIVHRGTLAYVVLNLYPYTAGHLMVVPFRHVPDYVDTTTAESDEIAELTKQAVRTLLKVSRAEGFNVGMNQGVAGGAGIAAHLHQHVVPRWVGDSNFMPIIGKTKTLPQLLTQTRDLFAANWQL